MAFDGSFLDYFNEQRKTVERVRALEIGAGAAPVLATLEEYVKTHPGRIIYRGTNSLGFFQSRWIVHDAYNHILPEDEQERNREAVRRDPKQFSLQRLARHTPQAPIDRLDICWYIEDLPFPFDDGYFTEVHCHMIDDPAVTIDGKPGIFGKLPTIEQFSAEMGRLLSPLGLFFISVQNGLFFDGDAQTGMDALVLSLEASGLSLVCRGYRNDLHKFTNYNFADDTLMAKKRDK